LSQNEITQNYNALKGRFKLLWVAELGPILFAMV
jgi:hypothetical protein